MSAATRSSNAALVPGQWSRLKLRLAIAVALLAGLGLLVAGSWSVLALLESDAGAAVGAGDQASASEGPVPSPSAALPAALTTAPIGRLTTSPATRLGAVGVPSGFPRTAEGAVAQLAAIDAAGLSPLSLPRAQEIASSWIEALGLTTEWSLLEGVRSLQSSVEATGAEAAGLAVEPAMGRIDQPVRDGEVVVCVDLVLALDGIATDRIAAADCQRMRWVGRRWVIASGEEVAAPESVWPGSQASADAGWLWLVSK